MDLRSIQQALQTEAESGSLLLVQVGNLISQVYTAIDQMPFGRLAAISEPDITIDQAANTMTLQGTGTWGSLEQVSMNVEVRPDPSDSDSCIVELKATGPPAAKLAIDNLDWFDMDSAWVSFKTFPRELYGTGLLPPAEIKLGATLRIGSGGSTAIPIVIEPTSAGELRLSLNTESVPFPTINDILAIFGSPPGFALPDTINQIASLSLQQLEVVIDPGTLSVTEIGVEIGSTDSGGDWEIVPGVLALHS